MEVPHLMQGKLRGLLKTLTTNSHHLVKHHPLSLLHEENNKSIDLLMVIKLAKLPNKAVAIDHNRIALVTEVVQRKTTSWQ